MKVTSNMHFGHSHRLKSALPWALRHLALSLVIAALLAALVIGLWFPSPFLCMLGGATLFLTVVVVDVVCGPVLTLLLIHAGKSRKALLTDIFMIAAIQMAALAYGLYTFSQGRPIAVVFEVDRFRVVSYADLDTSRSEAVPDWVHPWGFANPRVLAVRKAKTAEEKMASVDMSLQGLEPGQRPDWWQEYEISVPEVMQRAKPLQKLLALHPRDAERIHSAAAKAAGIPQEYKTQRPEDLLWLPVVSRQSMDWVALLDPQSARIRGYVHADGFGG